MREYDLSNRMFADESALDRACNEIWIKLTPERLKTVTNSKWLTQVNKMGLVFIGQLRCIESLLELRTPKGST